MWADLDRFRSEIGTDRLDIVLLHCMLSADWPKEKAGAMHVLSEAKQKGIIRAHGVSCHDLGRDEDGRRQRLGRRRPRAPEPRGIQMDADPATIVSVLRTMKKQGEGRHRHEDLRGWAACASGPTRRCSTRWRRTCSIASRSAARTRRSSRTCSRESRRPAPAPDRHPGCGRHAARAFGPASRPAFGYTQLVQRDSACHVAGLPEGGVREPV